MNNRIAKKILLCTSSLHLDTSKVIIARLQYRKNPHWFNQQGIRLVFWNSIDYNRRGDSP